MTNNNNQGAVQGEMYWGGEENDFAKEILKEGALGETSKEKRTKYIKL